MGFCFLQRNLFWGVDVFAYLNQVNKVGRWSECDSCLTASLAIPGSTRHHTAYNPPRTTPRVQPPPPINVLFAF